MACRNSGNSPSDTWAPERIPEERDRENPDRRLHIELQRLRQIADRMERNERRGGFGNLAMNGMARSAFGGMLFMLIVMLTMHGFMRIFQGFYQAFF